MENNLEFDYFEKTYKISRLNGSNTISIETCIDLMTKIQKYHQDRILACTNLRNNSNQHDLPTYSEKVILKENANKIDEIEPKIKYDIERLIATLTEIKDTSIMYVNFAQMTRDYANLKKDGE